MLAPLGGIAVVLASGITLLAGLAALQSSCALHPELVRKALHIGIGMIVLSFPWLFTDIWPVLAITGAGLLILSLRNATALGRHFGGVLDRVSRQSEGDAYFLIAIAILFALSRDDALLFVVPLLVLTFADSAAALVGVRYGRLRYAIACGGKSVEGSAAFLVVAFLCAQIPILLLGHAGPAEALDVSASLACIATVTEALTHKGLDNLFVPLAAFASLLFLS